MSARPFKTLDEEFRWNVTRIITAAEVFLGIDRLLDQGTGRVRTDLHVAFAFASDAPRCGAGCRIDMPPGHVPRGKIIAYEAGGDDLYGHDMRLRLHVMNDDDPVFRTFATHLVFDGRDWALEFRDSRQGDPTLHP